MSTVHLRNWFQGLIAPILNSCVHKSNLILLGFSLCPLHCTVTFCLSSQSVQVNTGLGKCLVRTESYKAKLWLLRDLASAVSNKGQLHIAHTVLIHSLYPVFIFCHSSFLTDITMWYQVVYYRSLKHCNTDFNQNYKIIKTSGLSYFDKIIWNGPLDTLLIVYRAYPALSILFILSDV